MSKIRVMKSAGKNGWKLVYWKIIMDFDIFEKMVLKKKLLKLINLYMNGNVSIGIISKKFCPPPKKGIAICNG